MFSLFKGGYSVLACLCSHRRCDKSREGFTMVDGASIIVKGAVIAVNTFLSVEGSNVGTRYSSS